MNVFLTVVLILLLVFFALALALAVVEEIFNRRRRRLREQRIADGSLRIVEITDEAHPEVAAAAGETPTAQSEPSDNVVEKIVYIPVAGIANKTYAEKYAELDAASKARLDGFMAYAEAQPGAKAAAGKDKITLRFKTHKVFAASIKRGVPVVAFMQTNPEFERFLKEKKIKSVKLKPVVVKLNTDESAVVAKELVDITCRLLERGGDALVTEG